jgi:hypothetical protein
MKKCDVDLIASLIEEVKGISLIFYAGGVAKFSGACIYARQSMADCESESTTLFHALASIATNLRPRPGE